MERDQESLLPQHQRTQSEFGCQPEAKNYPIGVFDSGVGGLTVLRQLQLSLPNESFLYFGDTANVPYGGRSPETLISLNRRILDWMSQYPVKMAVMACNTSSAWALEQIRHEYPFPILGIILPAAKAASALGRRIGLIATEGTVNSGCYERAIREIDPAAELYPMACPEFVPLIEHGKLDGIEIQQAIAARIGPLLAAKIDVLIYGCTHYPHLESAIRAFIPSSLRLVDPAFHIAKAVRQELDLLRLDAKSDGSSTSFFVSANPEQFSSLTATLMNFSPQVEQINLEGVPIVT